MPERRKGGRSSKSYKREVRVRAGEVVFDGTSRGRTGECRIPLSASAVRLLKMDLLARQLEPGGAQQILLKPLPQGPVQVVAELAVVVHLAPTIATPFAAGHIHEEVAVVLVVVEASVVAVLGASALRETVDHALGQEAHVLADPGLCRVELLQSVLLLVFPLHVLLLVGDGVPPHVQQAVRPLTLANEEGAQVEAGAVLRQDEVDRARLAIADIAPGHVVEVHVIQGVGEVEGVVLVDVAVDVLLEFVEDVVLQ